MRTQDAGPGRVGASADTAPEDWDLQKRWTRQRSGGWIEIRLTPYPGTASTLSREASQREGAAGRRSALWQGERSANWLRKRAWAWRPCGSMNGAGYSSNRANPSRVTEPIPIATWSRFATSRKRRGSASLSATRKL